MAPRRKVIPVTLTSAQRERLERFWFYFGNYGPEATPGNHSFIQRLLENGYDERPLHSKRTPKSELPTPRCEAAVEAVLGMKRAAGPERVEGPGGGLAVVRNHKEHDRPGVGPEMKAVVDDMWRRHLAGRERPDAHGDTPEAA